MYDFARKQVSFIFLANIVMIMSLQTNLRWYVLIFRTKPIQQTS